MTAIEPKKSGNRFISPGPVASAFLRSKAPVRIIQGPIESGKSVTSIMALYALMCTMPRDVTGKRRSRMLVTRTTYPELRNSTIESIHDWLKIDTYCKPGGGKFYDTEPFLMEFRFLDVVSDWIFEAFPDDKPETIRMLRSKEYTAAYINEAQYVPQTLFSEIVSRTGRFPKKIDMPDDYVRQTRTVADLNAPPTDDHWILRMRGDVELPVEMLPDERAKFAKPFGWEFFRQPSALIETLTPDRKSVANYSVNPRAENLANMQDGVRSMADLKEAIANGSRSILPHRYLELVAAKSKGEIDRDLMGRVVRIIRGEPVTPTFRRERHVGPADMAPLPGATVVVGADHGLTPAAVFGQQINGGWVIFHELVEFNMGTDEFAPLVSAKLATEFPESDYVAWGDPQGGWRTGTSADLNRTPFKIYAANGVEMRAPAAKDDPQRRMEATRKALNTEHNGRPRLYVHPRCTHLIAALEGGGQLRRMSTADGLRLTEEIVKNSASHVLEALMYLLWGGGEVRGMLQAAGGDRKKVVSAIPKRRDLFKFSRKKR